MPGRGCKPVFFLAQGITFLSCDNKIFVFSILLPDPGCKPVFFLAQGITFLSCDNKILVFSILLPGPGREHLCKPGLL